LVGKKADEGASVARSTSTRRPDDAAIETHRVQLGDTMSSLAATYYGSGKYTQFLIDSNPQIEDPNRLRVGMTVKIPGKPDEPVAAAGPTPRTRPGTERTAGSRTYRVQPGDSFYKIAEDQLGDASRWEELFELNRAAVHGDPKRLQVGQVLVLPRR
jgi:nucleoid-associated protein YgaU